jgi:hypothetical protein
MPPGVVPSRHGWRPLCRAGNRRVNRVVRRGQWPEPLRVKPGVGSQLGRARSCLVLRKLKVDGDAVSSLCQLMRD